MHNMAATESYFDTSKTVAKRRVQDRGENKGARSFLAYLFAVSLLLSALGMWIFSNDAGGAATSLIKLGVSIGFTGFSLLMICK
jgi:hypothetical protein